MKVKHSSLLLMFAFAALGSPSLAAKPLVIVNLNDNNGLTTTPVPAYPEEAARQGWGGVGLFKLQFGKDGAVDDVIVLISIDHELLDRAATTSLAKWRCQPGALRTANITMSFRAKKSDGAISVALDGEKPRNLILAPTPPFPNEARRTRFTGSGVFMLHFRPDGSVDKVFPARSTGNDAIDADCALSLSKWHCRPGAYTAIFVPIILSAQGFRRR